MLIYRTDPILFVEIGVSFSNSLNNNLVFSGKARFLIHFCSYFEMYKGIISQLSIQVTTHRPRSTIPYSKSKRSPRWREWDWFSSANREAGIALSLRWRDLRARSSRVGENETTANILEGKVSMLIFGLYYDIRRINKRG